MSGVKKQSSNRRVDYQNAIEPYINSRPSAGHIKRVFEESHLRSRTMVHINLHGRLFVLPRSTCERIPRLKEKLCKRKESKGTPAPWLSLFHRVIWFERNASVFAAVVDYVQNNELHVPQEICPKLFAQELHFWGFDIDEIEPCCFPGVVHFLYEQQKLNEFHGFLHSTKTINWDGCTECMREENCGHLKGFSKVRVTMWKILDEPFTSMKAQVEQLRWQTEDVDPTNKKVYFWVLCFFILLSLFAIAAETHEYFQIRDVRNKTRSSDFIFYLGQTSSAYLYTDYILRLIFFPHLRYFFHDLINITDGLALSSSIAKVFLDYFLEIDDEYESWTSAIDMLQLLRILRLLRPMSKLTGFRLIYFTLKCSFRELMLVFMLLVFLTIVFSSLLYYLGDRTAIKSIPHAMWYSLTTMTTVGYGDIVPEKARTMILGSVVAVFGVIMMSMTTPIMVSNFHSLYLNAAVGQPSAVKKFSSDSGSESPTNLRPGEDPDFSAPAGTFRRRRMAFSSLKIKRKDNGTSTPDSQKQQSEESAQLENEKQGCCQRLCCGQPSKKRIDPEETISDTLIAGHSVSIPKDIFRAIPFLEGVHEKSESVESETDEDMAVADNLDGEEADSEDEDEEDKEEGEFARSDVEDSDITAMDRNRELLQPRPRSWFHSYSTSDTDLEPKPSQTPPKVDEAPVAEKQTHKRKVTWSETKPSSTRMKTKKSKVHKTTVTAYRSHTSSRRS